MPKKNIITICLNFLQFVQLEMAFTCDSRNFDGISFIILFTESVLHQIRLRGNKVAG